MLAYETEALATEADTKAFSVETEDKTKTFSLEAEAIPRRLKFQVFNQGENEASRPTLNPR